MVSHIQSLKDLRRAIKISINHPKIVFREQMYEVVTDFLNKTGLINKSMDILKEELMCAVCLDIPLEAYLTKCHHIFCAHCLLIWLQNDRHCPMCRTFLLSSDYETLQMIDMIVFAVRTKYDSQYQSWAELEKHERFCLFNTNQLRRMHDKIIKSLENVKSSNNDETLTEELSKLSQGFLSLLKELPCSEADANSFRKKKRELFVSSKHTLKRLEALGYLKLC